MVLTGNLRAHILSDSLNTNNNMNNEEIRHDIEDRILKVSGALNSIWSNNYFDGLSKRDLISTEKLLKKIRKDNKINIIVSSIIAFVILLFTILQRFNLVKDFDLSVFILFAIVIFINTFNMYRIKLSIEHTFYLQKLLEKMKQK